MEKLTFRPTFEEVSQLAETGLYGTIPVSCVIENDSITPVDVMQRMKKVSDHCYMLESFEDSKEWGRYSFLGCHPLMELTCLNNVTTVKTKLTAQEIPGDPKEYIRKIINDNKSPVFDYLPPFTGGLVGYFSYDYIKYAEPTLDLDAEDRDGFKDMDMMLFDKVIAFDNSKNQIVVMVNMDAHSYKTSYYAAVNDCAALRDMILNGEKAENEPLKLKSDFTPLFDKQRYCKMVETAKHYIYEGDIFQVVLSNRLEAEIEGSLFDTYKILCNKNPSPYMFYFSGGSGEIAGASPETLVKLENGVLHTFPLAGTRPRGKTAEEDKALEEELLRDEKELAEHNMLVDLGRNDIGKISKFGTVEVEKYMQIQRFSHVMHIGSTVRGEIADGKDTIDAVDAILPAGTLSGAPKIRACEIINELENNKRGIYGGAIGYISFAGNLDTCIAIRLAFSKNNKVFIRSGAGIVADSVPEKEYEECLHKAAAVINAVKAAGGVR
ncbi:MAG: anthranilate synthase component I [Firmicutes bacterium]|nr:anthranilate synthase component I [Bacillota bacterium]